MYRLTALAGAALLVLSAGFAQAQDTSVPQPAPVPVDPPPAPVYEYVQQATSMQYDGTTMTLQGVSPSTIFFSDRPYRLTGQVTNDTFVNLWNAPDGPFASDPPNAAVSVLGAPNQEPAIVELTSAAVNGTDLQYEVTVLSGTLPDNAENVAVFVDHGPRPRARARTRTHPAGRHMGYYPYGPHHPVPGPYCYHAPQAPECRYGPYHPYHPYHPVPGPYCYHAPQAPECRYHPYRPYPPYPPPYHPYYYPGAAFATGAVVGAAAASSNQPQQQQTYIYPIPSGPIPANCYINSNHTRMICSVPLN